MALYFFIVVSSLIMGDELGTKVAVSRVQVWNQF